MNIKINVLILLAGLVLFSGCNKDPEALTVQGLVKHSDEYYANLRAWKKTPHQVSFFFYEAYAQIEGVDGYKDPASWGERIMGIPDSVDIVNLWMGIPSNDPKESNYMPIAYADMRYVQKVKGTRFVSHTDASQKTRIVEGVEYNFAVNTRETVIAYGEALVAQALKYDLDGIDVDFEPASGAIWNDDQWITLLAQTIGAHFGPMGTNPEKLLIIDFYSHNPPSTTKPYVSYYVRQAYTQGMTEMKATNLQSYYNSMSWSDPDKFIVTENLGSWSENGGSPFTEVDNNKVSAYGGRMYSLEGMARWNPTISGEVKEKGGFGGFYLGRCYYAVNGPYTDVYRAIQQANPAGK